MKYYWSDSHFNHEGILTLASRPFRNLKEMTKTLIRNFNDVVSDDDVTYCVGDFAMARHYELNIITRIFDQLNGTHHLILGNHDEFKPFDYVRMGFKTVHTALELDLNITNEEALYREEYKVILVHDPCVSCIDRNKIFICGHIHDLFLIQENVINVGVEMWGFKPVSETEITNLIDRIKK